MSLYDVCTLCGGARGPGRKFFDQHIDSERHQHAVRKWDERHQSPRPVDSLRSPHHAGHVLLGISCNCRVKAMA